MEEKVAMFIVILAIFLLQRKLDRGDKYFNKDLDPGIRITYADAVDIDNHLALPSLAANDVPLLTTTNITYRYWGFCFY